MAISFLSSCPELPGIRETKVLLSQFIPSKCHRYKAFFFVVTGQHKQIACFVSNLGKQPQKLLLIVDETLRLSCMSVFEWFLNRADQKVGPLISQT
jgi:hypothetical protein